MSISSINAHKFYKEVSKSRKLWTLQDDAGIPAPKNPDGQRAMPFWSSRARVEKVIQTVPAYAGFTPKELGWDEFVEEWIPELRKDDVLVGLNWSGDRARGYDLKPEDVKRNVEAAMIRQSENN